LLGKILLEKGNYFGAVAEFALIANYSDEPKKLIAKIEDQLKNTEFFRNEMNKNPRDVWAKAFYALSLVFNDQQSQGIGMLLDLHKQQPWKYEFVEQNIVHAWITIGRPDNALEFAKKMAEKNIMPYRVNIPVLEYKE